MANDLWIASCGYGDSLVVGAEERAIPEWSGLYARLSAAHALRREMVCGEGAPAVLRGSFSDWTLPGCDGPARKRGINLKDSTDRKGLQGMDFGCAGPVHAGNREQ